MEEKTNGRIGYASAPTFAFAETDGTWGVEGHGVDPGIEVVDDPALMVDSGNLQLDAAIEHRLAESEWVPDVQPQRPAHAGHSGMGIREEDKWTRGARSHKRHQCDAATSRPSNPAENGKVAS